jgi:hypothetical protein
MTEINKSGSIKGEFNLWKEHEKLVLKVPRLKELSEQIQAVEKQYEDKDFDTEYQNMEMKKKVLDEIINDYLFYQNSIERGDATDMMKEEIFGYAKKYLDSEFLHNQYLTNKILVQVLDTELVPLEEELSGKRILPGVTSLTDLLLPHYLRFVFKNKRTKVHLNNLAKVAGYLRIVRDEAHLGNFNAEVISRRLQSYEKEGLHVPSLAYSLLSISK